MKYPLKALMPKDVNGNYMSDEAWEKLQKFLVRVEMRLQAKWAKEGKSA